jgi:type I restriction-modification system DNA methylase subunit
LRKNYGNAEQLRGKVEVSNYKYFACGLMFLKFISERHNFYIPENERWTVLSSTAENIGEKIDVG